MGWFDDAVDAVSETAGDVYDGAAGAVESVSETAGDMYDSASETVSDAYDSASESVSNWLGSGPNTSDAATAQGGDSLLNEEPDSWWGQVGQTIGDIGRGVDQEGVTGLLDVGGMIDRQDAQRQLSNRFQVVGDDFTGERQHNQVSQEEYEEIARTFSNIRTGRGDLTIDSSRFSPFAGDDQEEWEQGIQANIADMMMTTDGRAQVMGLSNNVVRNDDGTAREHLWGLGPEVHHHTTIEPLFGKQNGVDSEGRTVWEDPWFWQRDASTLRDDNAFARPEGSGSRRDETTMERGSGTDSTILINPGEILGLRSDVVMAHEMQHALHQTQGTNGVGKFGGTGDDVKVNNSERQAVGLTRSDTPTGGHYPGDPDGCTENTYRQQRNDLGDRFLPRERYGHLPGEAPATMSDADLQRKWDTHNASSNVPSP